jgi:hypothetical protein
MLNPGLCLPEVNSYRESLEDPVHPLYNAYEPTIEYAGERDENIKMGDSATSTLEAGQSLPSRPELGVRLRAEEEE